MPGSAASDWSWQPVFMDVDLDGWEDMIIPAGFVHDMNDMDVMRRSISPGRAGGLAPRELGPDGQPVARTPQEQMDKERYQRNMLASR